MKLLFLIFSVTFFFVSETVETSAVFNLDLIKENNEDLIRYISESQYDVISEIERRKRGIGEALTRGVVRGAIHGERRRQEREKMKQEILKEIRAENNQKKKKKIKVKIPDINRQRGGNRNSQKKEGKTKDNKGNTETPQDVVNRGDAETVQGEAS